MTKQELKDLRHQHRLTQAQLAELLGYSVNHVARLENDPRVTIPLKLAKNIRRILQKEQNTP